MKEKPKIYKLKKKFDKRGSFSKLLSNINNKKILKNEKISEVSVSSNKKIGTVRGLHYQSGKYAETKIIYCLQGKILDISININKKSKFFKKVYKFTLNDKSKNFLVIPKNYAHGFQTLKKNTILLYLTSKPFNKKFERTINPLINNLNIKLNWPLKIKSISKKDLNS